METGDSANTGKQKIIPFVTEVARYFMDFLETDFHKVRNPKRQVQYRNKDNLQICIDLSRYVRYSALVWQVIRSGYKADGNGFENDSLDSLKPSCHILKISKALIELIQKQIDIIEPIQIEKLINKFESEISISCTKYEKNSIQAINYSIDGISRIIKEEFISKFIDKIREPLDKLTGSVVDSIYQVEEDLNNILIEPFEDTISTIVNNRQLDIKKDDNKLLHEIFEIEDVKNKLSSFFNGRVQKRSAIPIFSHDLLSTSKGVL